jgi:hypothetical protein
MDRKGLLPCLQKPTTDLKTILYTQLVGTYLYPSSHKISYLHLYFFLFVIAVRLKAT